MKEKPANNSDTQIVMDAIRCIVHALRVASRTFERELGLSAAQLFVMRRLADSKALSINELAQRTLTHQSSVSVVVQKLAKAGMVLASPSPIDGRRIELALTGKGRRTISRSPEAMQDKLIEALDNMPGESRRRLAQLLQDLVGRAGIGQEFPVLFMEDNQHSLANNGKERH